MTAMRTAATAAALVLLLAACTAAEPEDTTTAGPAATSAPAPSVSAAPSTTATDTTAATTTTTGAVPTSTGPLAPSAADITLPTELRITPRQAEGPYYPVTKPADRDNDLLVVADGAPTTIGTPLEVSGLLVSDDGTRLVGATVEIWQVDGQGIYDHPNAPGTGDRDVSFQFYGESVTDQQGFWTFLTVDPVLYESRPRHIHVKIKIDGAEVLTTQLYFDGDPLLTEDGLAAAAGDDLVLLTTNAKSATLSNGLDGLSAQHVIVIAG